MNKSYNFAYIGINKDNKYVVTYLGEQPDQGGLCFDWGSVTIDTLESAIEYLKLVTKQSEESYKKLIEKKKSEGEL